MILGEVSCQCDIGAGMVNVWLAEVLITFPFCIRLMKL
jgi:hypothetical protein